MANRKKLSDATVQTALKAIEAEINPLAEGLKEPHSIDEAQALFDARRELSAMAAPSKPSTFERAQKGVRRRTEKVNPRDVAILGGDPSL